MESLSNRLPKSNPRHKFSLKIKMGGGWGRAVPHLRANAPKKTSARRARARSAAKTPLVKNVFPDDWQRFWIFQVLTRIKPFPVGLKILDAEDREENQNAPMNLWQDLAGGSAEHPYLEWEAVLLCHIVEDVALFLQVPCHSQQLHQLARLLLLTYIVHTSLIKVGSPLISSMITVSYGRLVSPFTVSRQMS